MYHGQHGQAGQWQTSQGQHFRVEQGNLGDVPQYPTQIGQPYGGDQGNNGGGVPQYPPQAIHPGAGFQEENNGVFKSAALPGQGIQMAYDPSQSQPTTSYPEDIPTSSHTYQPHQTIQYRGGVAPLINESGQTPHGYYQQGPGYQYGHQRPPQSTHSLQNHNQNYHQNISQPEPYGPQLENYHTDPSYYRQPYRNPDQGNLGHPFQHSHHGPYYSQGHPHHNHNPRHNFQSSFGQHVHEGHEGYLPSNGGRGAWNGQIYPQRGHHPSRGRGRGIYSNERFPYYDDDDHIPYKKKPRRRVRFDLTDREDVESWSEEDTQVKPRKKKTLKPKTKSSLKKPKSDSSEEDKPKKGVKSKKQARYKRVTTVRKFESLKGLSSLSKLSSQDTKYKTLVKYIENSSDVEPSQIKIHSIQEFKVPSSFGGSHVTTFTRKLLFSKTTPGFVNRLAQKRDRPVAYYDRIARALAVKPIEVMQPLRQIVLICSVSLGKLYRDKSGYRHWSKLDFPPGFDSVMGTGRLIPDPKDDRDDNGTIIPIGTTIKNRDFKSFEQDYNEYIIVECRRSVPRYAVDIEIIPEDSASSEEEEYSESD